MKKLICTCCLMLLVLGIAGCGDRVADPEALFNKYLTDDAARKAKLRECELLSTDDQLKSQSCNIAHRADSHKEVSKKGGVKFKFKDPFKKG